MSGHTAQTAADVANEPAIINSRGDSTVPSVAQAFPQTIAIIGASLSGLSLALALVRSDLFPASKITIYDLRSSPQSKSSSDASTSQDQQQSGFNPSTTASGIILTPNGLSVLSYIGVFELIRKRCWTATHRTFRSDPGDKLVKKVRISGQEAGYGFENHRVWRSVLLEVLLGEVEKSGVTVGWGWRFEEIIPDDDSTKSRRGMQFKLSRRGHDGEADKRIEEIQQTDMLVGADGIYSTVRKYLDPNAKPIYTGTTGVLAHIRWEDVDWPLVKSPGVASSTSSATTEQLEEHPYERQCTLQGNPGALFWLPEDAQGNVIMIGKQTRMAEPIPKSPNQSTREAWEALSQDKAFLTKFYRDGYDEWGETGRKIIDAVCDDNKGRDTLYLWPFMRMEKLASWFASAGSSAEDGHDGTVLILGDAAHALPPSSGQGVNQTLEDVYVLSKVMKFVKDVQKDMNEALRFWQEIRQSRIEDVYEWATGVTNVSRLSKTEREKEQAEKQAEAGDEGKAGRRGADDMSWLYLPDWDDAIDRWGKK